jgi:signal transduction histidine kinase
MPGSWIASRIVDDTARHLVMPHWRVISFKIGDCPFQYPRGRAAYLPADSESCRGVLITCERMCATAPSATLFWQTVWFRTVCVSVFAGIPWAAFYRLRMRQVAREFELGLEARVAERTRIARELHDTLLQSFNGALLRFQTVSELLLRRPAEAKHVLDGAIDQAAKAIKEGRQAVEDLRSSVEESADLADAIGRLSEEFSAATSEEDRAPGASHTATAFRMEVEGATRLLRPIVRDEIYRIAAEALRNAFQHSHGTRIEAELRCGERQFRLRIRDDGRGVDPEILAQGGRKGHFGLRGMHERAELAGGKLDVWSAPDSGTEVELTIPASCAYRPARASRRDGRK